MAQAMWNGFLRISLVSCPVSLSPVVVAGRRVQLDDVNARTGNPVTEQFVDAKTGNVVSPNAIAKGVRVNGGTYTVLSEDELKGIASRPANILDIEEFVPKGQIDRIYFDDVCYVHPDGDLAADTLHALSLALAGKDRVGLGRATLGGRERAVMIEPHGSGLRLSTLHSPDEIEPSEFAERSADLIPGEMVEVAETIIGRRSRDFQPTMLDDRADAKLRELLDHKTGAAPTPALEPPPPPPPPRVETAPEPPPPPEPEPEPPPPVAAAPDPEPSPEPPAPEPPPRPVLVAATPPAPEPHPDPAAPEPPAADPVVQPGADAVAAPAVEEPVEPSPEPAGPKDLGAEVLLHIMGLGDRRYVETGWAGNPGSKRQIEALSIRPREELPASAVEFRVFAQEGRATAWVTNGNYAGTRGRGLPLTGFAVRPAPNLGEDLEIVYEGSFFEGGVVGPKRDGELCVSPIADDPLEAVRVSIVQRKPA